MPLSAQPQPSRSVCGAGQAATRAWAGASSACGPWRLRSNGEACNPEGLAGGASGAGKRDSLSRGKCLTASSPLGWSGAPILLANQPDMGLIPGLCPVIASLVHLLLRLMSPSPPRGAVEGVLCFSVCTTVYCLKPHPQSRCVLVGSCARRAVPASDRKPPSPVHAFPPHPAEA